MVVTQLVFFALVITCLVLALVLPFQSVQNYGEAKFGTLTVKDISTQTPTRQIRPGDQLELQYNVLNTSPGAFTVDWLWSVNDQGFQVIEANTTSNRLVFQIPDTTFSDQVYFQVRDANNNLDYVTSEVQQVVPVLHVTQGPGLQTGGTVFRNRTVTMTVEVDAILPDLNLAEDYTLVVSTSVDFSQFTPAFVTAVNGQDLSWVTDFQGTSPVYYKLETTRLVNDGFPFELSFISPFPMTIAAPPACEGPGPEALTLCSIFMRHPGGYVTPFAALQNVELVGSFAGDLDANTIVWAYSIDGTNFTDFSGVFGPTVQYTSDAVYTATLPDLVSTTFTLRATYTGGTAFSVPYDIGYLVSFPDLPKVYVNPPDPPIPNYVQTTVTTEPALNPAFVSNWNVTISNPDGSNLQSFPVDTFFISGNQVLVIWILSDQQVPFGGNTSVDLKLGFTFQVNTDTITITEAQTTNFKQQNWVPHYAQMKNVASNVGSNEFIFPTVGAFSNLLGSSTNTPALNWWRKQVATDQYQICVYDGTQGPPWIYACFDNKWLNNPLVAGTLPYNQNPASFTLTKSGIDTLITSNTQPSQMCGKFSSLQVYAYDFKDACDPADNSEPMTVRWL